MVTIRGGNLYNFGNVRGTPASKVQPQCMRVQPQPGRGTCVGPRCSAVSLSGRSFDLKGPSGSLKGPSAGAGGSFAGLRGLFVGLKGPSFSLRGSCFSLIGSATGTLIAGAPCPVRHSYWSWDGMNARCFVPTITSLCGRERLMMAICNVDHARYYA